MTPAQIEDLFIEWDLYGPREKDAMMQEFCEKFYGNYTLNGFHNFLKDKLDIEGYWNKIGLM